MAHAYRSSTTTVNRELSETAFIRAIALFTGVMGVITTLGALWTYSWNLSIWGILACFAGAVICIFIYVWSDSPVISFAGVGGMSFLMGMMIGPVVALFSTVVILKALVATTGTMVGMSIIGVMFPTAFRGWGAYLMAGLTLLLVAQFAQMFLIAAGFKDAAEMPLLTWVGVVIFIAFIPYDWNKALEDDHTLDKAIDASGGLILDAINLFIRFLEIFGSGGGSGSDGGSILSDIVDSATE